jgi:hypothetical protein
MFVIINILLLLQGGILQSIPWAATIFSSVAHNSFSHKSVCREFVEISVVLTPDS